MTRSPLAAVGLVVLVAIPLLFAGLGGAPFDDPGEGMHAEIARELVGSGDPFALTLNGVRYVDKPPLLYILLAGAFGVGGASEGSARAVSALAALVAVAATAWLGARLLGPGGGALAGVALLSSGFFFAYARYVRPEALFVAALAGGFALALAGLRDGRRWLTGLGLAVFGVAGLAKDPLGALAPPLAILVALALAGRPRPLGRCLPWPALAACAALGVGWWLLAELRTAGTVWYTVIDNHVLNVARARNFPDEDVPLGAAEFLAVAVLGALPWSVAAGMSALRLARRRAWRAPEEVPWVALALWTLGVLGTAALSGFRLPHYGLPAYPAVALLAARTWWKDDPRPLLLVHGALFAAVTAACALAWASDGARFMDSVIGATDVATRKSRLAGEADPFPPWAAIRPLLGATAGVFAAGTALCAAALALRGDRRRGAAVAAVAVTMLAAMPAVGSATALMSGHRAVRDLALIVARQAGAGDVVAHEGPIEGSGAFEWYSGRRPVIVDGRRSVLGFGATRGDAADAFWEREELREAWGDGRRVWVVTTRSPERSIAAALPGARLVRATAGRWLYVNAPATR